MAKRLILGQIGADFDPAVDAVIAPWCFAGAEDVYADWESLAFRDILTDVDIRAKAGDDVRLLANYLIGPWAERLNAEHGVTHGATYWRILLMPWLLHVSQAVWKRYLLIADFIAAHEGDGTTFAVEIGPAVMDCRPVDMFDLNRRILPSHGFNFWLNGRIITALAPDHWQHIPVAGVAIAPYVPPPAGATGIKGFLRAVFRDLRCRQVSGVRWMALPLSVYLALLPRKARHVPARSTPSRADIEQIFPVPFLDLLNMVLAKTQPQALSDGYAAREAPAARRRYKSGRINLLGPVLVLDEDAKFTYAHAAEHGERIVCTQHGGGSCLKINVNGIEVEYVHDAYLSWGWEGREDYPGHIVPVPSPLYSTYVDRHKERDGTLVFVAGEERIFAHRLETSHQPAQAVHSRRDRRAFLEALTPGLRNHLRYRPYPGGHGVLPDEAYMRRHFPGLQTLGGVLEPRLLGCRLLVVDHPTTTFSLAMAANVPTIAILHPEVWSFARQAAPYFARLAEAGVIFADPAAAAAKTEAVWRDVAAWWQDPAIQSARQDFCAAYAATNRWWWLDWAKALHKL